MKTANNQHYIPIVDAALAHTTNATDVVSSISVFTCLVTKHQFCQYDPYTKGVDL